MRARSPSQLSGIERPIRLTYAALVREYRALAGSYLISFLHRAIPIELL
jgi:hypothetical protein